MTREEQLLEVWKTTIDVQKHFNELEMRIRSVAVTVLAAFLAAAGYTLKESMSLNVFGFDLSLTVLVFVAAAICWSAFYLMDRFWYHRLLRGAVKHGLAVEAALSTSLPEIGLTKAIGDASPFTVRGKTFGSNEKMDWFYGTILLLLVVAALAVLFNRSPASARSVAAEGTASMERRPGPASETAAPRERASPKATADGNVGQPQSEAR